MNVKVVTPPTTEPISLTEAKLHCRVDETADDALITALITVAREEVQRMSYHALMPQTLELVLDRWVHPIVLPYPPLTSVTSIKYVDEDAVETTWASTNYLVSVDRIPALIVLKPNKELPSATLYPQEAIRVRYVAGYATAAAVPQSLKQAMLLLIGHWYENRENTTVGAIARDIPFGVDALCRNYRLRARMVA